MNVCFSNFEGIQDFKNNLEAIKGLQEFKIHSSKVARHVSHGAPFIPKLLVRCGLLAWTRFRLILKMYWLSVFCKGEEKIALGGL